MLVPPLLIPAGVVGLSKSDFRFRFYRGGVRDLDITANDGGSAIVAMGFVPTGSLLNKYKITGLPNPNPVTTFTLTYEYPAGIGFYLVYGGKHVPSNIVIPVRETGLVKADLSLSIYLDGVEQTSINTALTVVEFGPLDSGGGDYLISGWPITTPGHWTLFWERAGITFSYDWTVPDLTSFYLGITSIQPPFEIGADSHDRTMWSANFISKGRGPVAFFELDIQSILAAAGLSTLGSDTLIGRNASIPDGDGPYIQIINTGGTATNIYHDRSRLENLTCQILVRAGGENGYTLSRDRITAIWHTLDGRFNNLDAD